MLWIRFKPAMLIPALTILVGCGGSGSVGNGGGGGGGNNLTIEQRLETLAAVNDRTTLLTEDNFSVEADRIIAFLRTRTEFSDVGRDSSGLKTIWARFTDGRMLEISRNRKPSEQEGVQQPGRAPGYSLPAGLRAQLFYGFEENYYADSTERLLQPLINAGYSPTSDPKNSSTVGDLLGMSNVGLLVVESHGSMIPLNPATPEEKSLVIMTRSVVSPELEASYASDLADKSLVYSNTKVGTRYSFSKLFVTKHLQFSRSIIVMNACSSAANDEMSEAFFAKGAGAYFGWTKPVEDQDARETALGMFELFLGVDGLRMWVTPDPSNPPEPPMEWQQVFDRLRITKRYQNDLNLDVSTSGAQLVVNARDAVVGTVLPSIRAASVNSSQGISLLQGFFGYTQGTVIGNPGTDNIPMSVQSWAPNAITTNYNPDVTSLRVLSGPRKSNIYKIGKSYTISGPSSGTFASKESIRFWVEEDLIYSGSGLAQTPITFTAIPGSILRFEVKSNQSFGGPGELWMKPPTSAAYRFVAKVFDYIPNPTTRVCFDGTIILQP